jgi:hypothetical protein
MARRCKEPQPEPESAPIYTSMRNQILTLVPAEVGLGPSPQFPHVWGVLTEIGLDRGSATLVSLADGTTSLYLSSGGGFIGYGELAAVAAASQALVLEAERYCGTMVPATVFPLPAAGRIRFYVLTFDGALTAEADEGEVVAGRHVLAPLFHRSDDVITQVRLHSPQAE